MIYTSLVKLAPTQPAKLNNPFCRMLRMSAIYLPGNKGVAWGIDPGVNFGLTVIEKDMGFVYHGSLVQMNDPGQYGLIAYKFLTDLISGGRGHAIGRMILEGAAYGATFRQVELSEIRTGFYIAAAMSDMPVKIVPPKSVRKVVFSDGTVQAGDVWPTLNHNAADSLAMALYALEKKDETK